MSSIRRDRPGSLVVRPTKVRVAGGWVLAAFGVLFGLSGLAESDTRILLPVVGLFFAGVGVALATAVAVITAEGVLYRYGLIRRSIPASEIESVDVRQGNGPAFVALRINRRGAKAVTLIGVQRDGTARGVTALELVATQMRSVLCLAADADS